jgi:nucleoside-diphosphate-sugar epimerase
MRAAAGAADLDGRVFNVGGGSRIALLDAVDLIGELSGRPLEVRHLPVPDGDLRDTGADTARAERTLGFTPATPFEDGLRAEFEWILSALDHGRSGP